MIKLNLKNLNVNNKKLLFKWANLKTVIKNSLSKKKIKKKDHDIWFKKKLKSKTDIIKIINLGDLPIGIIRLEKKDKNYFISYLIAPKYRKKGNAYKGLKFFLVFLKKRKKPKKVFALVKEDNSPSIKIFKKLKFKIIKNQSKIITFISKID